MTEPVRRCPRSPWSINTEGVLRRVWSSGSRLWWGTDSCWDFIRWLTSNHYNAEWWVLHDLPSNGRFETGLEWETVDLVKMHISTIHFGHWEAVGVSESCRTRITGWSKPRDYWTDAVAFRYTWKYLGAPGRTKEPWWEAWNCWPEAWERQQPWDHVQSL